MKKKYFLTSYILFCGLFFCGEIFLFADGDPFSSPRLDLYTEKKSNQETHLSDDFKSKVEEIQQKIFRDSEDWLRLYLYGEEIFSASNDIKGESVLISSDSGRAVRKFFDAEKKLSKIETWRVGDKDAEIVSIESFIYENATKNADGENQSKKISKSIFYTNEKIVENAYDANGFITTSDEFEILLTNSLAGVSEKNAKNQNAENAESNASQNDENEKVLQKKSYLQDLQKSLPALQKQLQKKSFWKYSEDGNLIEENVEKIKNGAVEFSETKKYFYHENPEAEKNESEKKQNEGDGDKEENAIPPDYEFYENGILRVRIVYVSSEEYEAKYFFDGNFVVSESYKDGKKDYESISQNNKIIREKKYE